MLVPIGSASAAASDIRTPFRGDDVPRRYPEKCVRNRLRELGGPRRTRARLPELHMESAGALEELGRVPVGEGPRNGNLRRPVAIEERLPSFAIAGPS